MEQIIIEVDGDVAKAYKKFSAESKRQFNLAVNLLLKKTANDASLPNYKKMLDTMGEEAVAKGLTPDILDALLKSDD
jgi:hypothetical protein